MATMRHTRLLGAVLAAVSLSTVVDASALQAQEQEDAEIGEARLRVFASAYVAMAVARDDFHREMGRTHEEQGRDRLRERLGERTTEILAEREMTREEYERITLAISIDAERRELFERILEEITGAE